MCGITGFWDLKGIIPRQEQQQIGRNMIRALSHRGPDGDGVWVDSNDSLILGHSRLSIQDLSNAGSQPMISVSSRYVITFNGEIYNFLELREQLIALGILFRGSSDTEVLLEGIEFWGLEEMLKKCNGMFAFALWDRDTKKLSLARDRAGKKPLYYGVHNGVFIFGSELKAMRMNPAFKANINYDSLSLLVKYSWIESPHCIFNNTNKLKPGTFVSLSRDVEMTSISPESYWSAKDVLEDAISHPYAGSLLDAEMQMEQLLEDATKKRMIADVETGALLSGGIDSSLVTALMQKNSVNRIKTFSIGYHEQTHNEAEHAKKVAEYLGTDHRELYVTAKDSMSVINDLPTLYDEPFADVSQIPTYLVSRLARENVKVVLTGDGGDETFAGYTRYKRCLDKWDEFKNIPAPVKSMIEGASRSYSSIHWKLINSISAATCKNRKVGKYQKIARRISAKTPEELFCRMNMRYGMYESPVLNGREPDNIFNCYDLIPRGASDLKKMQYIDYENYLIDDVLTKVDRAAMAVSLETRSPILDYRVLELAWRFPDEYVLKGGNKKAILKNILYKLVPRELVERPKLGFGVPMGDWLRGDLNAWAEDLLSSDYIKRQGIFDSKFIDKYWGQHKKECAKHDTLIWSILMFQSWYQENYK